MEEQEEEWGPLIAHDGKSCPEAERIRPRCSAKPRKSSMTPSKGSLRPTTDNQFRLTDTDMPKQWPYPNCYPLDACVWYRESTEEFIFEIEGTIDDVHFTKRIPAPSRMTPVQVAELEHWEDAALAKLPEGVEVRPLEWEDHLDYGIHFTSHHEWGNYDLKKISKDENLWKLEASVLEGPINEMMRGTYAACVREANRDHTENILEYFSDRPEIHNDGWRPLKSAPVRQWVEVWTPPVQGQYGASLRIARYNPDESLWEWPGPEVGDFWTQEGLAKAEREMQRNHRCTSDGSEMSHFRRLTRAPYLPGANQ